MTPFVSKMRSQQGGRQETVTLPTTGPVVKVCPFTLSLAFPLQPWFRLRLSLSSSRALVSRLTLLDSLRLRLRHRSLPDVLQLPPSLGSCLSALYSLQAAAFGCGIKDSRPLQSAGNLCLLLLSLSRDCGSRCGSSLPDACLLADPRKNRAKYAHVQPAPYRVNQRLQLRRNRLWYKVAASKPPDWL